MEVIVDNNVDKKNRLDYLKEFVFCECGIEIMRGNLSNHRKSQKHLNQMQKNNFISPESIDSKFKVIDSKIELLYGKLALIHDLLLNK